MLAGWLERGLLRCCCLATAYLSRYHRTLLYPSPVGWLRSVASTYMPVFSLSFSFLAGWYTATRKSDEPRRVAPPPTRTSQRVCPSAPAFKLHTRRTALPMRCKGTSRVALLPEFLLERTCEEAFSMKLINHLLRRFDTYLK